jgi:glucan-binding YG repeat protein
MKRILCVVAIAMVAVSCWASSPYDDLTKLVKSGTNEDVIISFINSSSASYSLTPDQIIQLKAMGASDKVIVAALKHERTSTASPAPKSGAASVPSQEAATAGPQATPPATAQDPNAVYEAVPSSGGWVLMNDYWYWQYPTGVVVDLGWQPYYYYHHGWFPGRGHRRW